MKVFFTMCVASLIAFASLAQTKTRVPDEVLNKSTEMGNYKISNVQMPFKVAPSTKSVALAPQEVEVGHTYYDLQSNSALSNRFYRYDDGSIVASWTGGMEASAFNDRGSFYNYWTKLQDQTWGWSINPDDVGRIEGYRAGWPSYSPYENGELILSHSTGLGIGIHKRDQVGTGNWNLTTQSISSTSNSWPRVCVNNGTIHVLEGNQSGTPTVNRVYYSRSKDGGETWSPHEETPELIGSNYYGSMAFITDDCVWAEPKDGIIAFAIFSSLADLVIMKSYNDGDTWEKIVAWEHPIPFFDYNTMIYTDTLYAPNGSGSIIIDDDGICHIAFNVNRYIITTLGEPGFYFGHAGHAYYWNETLDPFTDLNNPYDALHLELHPEYLQDGRCILAYGFDFDGDRTWFGTQEGAGLTYYNCTGTISHISMTQVSSDRLVFALAVTDESAPLAASGGTYYAKRIFLCSYVFNEVYEEWRFDTDWVTDPDMVSYDLFTETPTQIDNKGWYRMIKGFAHSFDECIYPQVLAQNVPAGELGGNFYVFYNVDQMPGDGLTEHDSNPQYGTYTDNTVIMWASAMNFGDPNFPEINFDGIEKHNPVSQKLKVYPNPASNMVNIAVEETVNCVIYNMAGQAVAKQILTPGNNIINIQLKPGVYFISAGNSNVKLIVE